MSLPKEQQRYLDALSLMQRARICLKKWEQRQANTSKELIRETRLILEAIQVWELSR